MKASGKSNKGFGCQVGPSKPRKKYVTMSTKAQLQFLVSRLGKYLKKGQYVKHVSTGASVYLVDVLEYLTVELVENTAKDYKKSHIIPRHLLLAIRNNKELGRLLSGVTIAHGGVLPNINLVLLLEKTIVMEGSAEKSSKKKAAQKPQKKVAAK